jgi:hypothetical protein
MSKKEQFAQIERKVDNSVKVLAETLDLYTNVKAQKKVDPKDINDLLNKIHVSKEELTWVSKTVKSVQANPLDLEFIRVQSEKKSADMAVKLLNAMAQTSPGRKYPSPAKMATTLGLEKRENRSEFENGYQVAIEKIQSSNLSAQQKTFNIWYWICMSMFGTMAFAIFALILRRIYEWFMDKRKEWAEWIAPEESQLKKFAIWTWLTKKKPPREILVPMVVQSSS